MARENFTNFATSALAVAISSTTALSFTVTTSQGALFPTSNFLVVIDTEIMNITSRTNDTFTVASGGRGYDGTQAAIHGQNAVVQHSWTRSHVNHIWQNVADTYTPEVPPVQLPGGSPSSFDNEFETTGNWTLAPAPSVGTTFGTGVVPSHLVLSRGTNDTSVYTAYVPYTSSATATFTCKVSNATYFTHNATGDQAHFHFFVTDQSNPSVGADTGTRFRVDTVVTANPSATSSLPARWVQASMDTTGSWSPIGPLVPVSTAYPLYLRITYNGTGSWVAYYGDGLTYWQLAWSPAGFNFAPQAVGFSFSSYIPSGQWMPHTVLVDYVRVVVGSMLPPFAN